MFITSINIPQDTLHHLGYDSHHGQLTRSLWRMIHILRCDYMPSWVDAASHSPHVAIHSARPSALPQG